MGLCALPIGVHGDYSGDIIINSDGSVSPSGAPLYTVDNVTYSLTQNITGSITLRRDDTILDGQRFSLEKPGYMPDFTIIGIDVVGNKRNVTIRNLNMVDGRYKAAIHLFNCTDFNITNNTIVGNHYSIWIEYSNDTIITNNVFNRNDRLFLNSSYRNRIADNDLIEYNGNIDIEYSDNNYISQNNMTSGSSVLGLFVSNNNTISGNRIIGRYQPYSPTGTTLQAIAICYSSHNIVEGNTLYGHRWGLDMAYARNNIITDNNIQNNTVGIRFYDYEGIHQSENSSSNIFFHNNLMDNNQTVVIMTPSTNDWNDGAEGNYWSDYNGTDNNQDGIGDTPHVIDANNTDHYPLMGHFENFNISTWSQPNDGFEEVDVISNFTISDLGLYVWLTTPNQYLQAGQLFLRLVPVQEHDMPAGFCRMTLPNDMLNTSDHIVLTDMAPISVNKLAISNNTHTTLYFTFNVSANEEIIIVPEFPSVLILPLLFMATLLTIIFCRKKLTRTA
jgi:parallel beta-helix repeat protein